MFVKITSNLYQFSCHFIIQKHLEAMSLQIIADGNAVQIGISGGMLMLTFRPNCRECEQYASHVQHAQLDFTTEEEKEQVQTVFDNAMQCLSETDRELEAIVHIAPLLKAGIGVHHSGLLPIVKELTELLFQEHLIKVWSEQI